jgi:hypothetical protein
MNNLGLAGRIAKYFINSKLTPLLVVSFFTPWIFCSIYNVKG